MKKRKFNAKTMRRFTTEPKVVHEAKPVDLITQYNRMRSIATDIYNSDFFMISSKAEQKKIEASIACISATMISMIGMEAIENSHDCLPDDSGNGNDHSLDNLPDDSGDYTDTDKASHDAIKKMMNIAYGKSESDGVKKATARQVLNSVYGATHSIMAMNRKILSELGTKSPTQIMHECLAHTDNECDDDSDKDDYDVDFGNFADGPFYSDKYRHICQLNGFDVSETLKRIVKTASDYTISKLNLVAVVTDKHDIKSDDKYYPNIGDVFFVTNKENDKDPVFVLICAKSHIESFNIDKVSTEIKPVELEESTKSDDIEFIGSDAYYGIDKAYRNSNQIIDLDTTLIKIKERARAKNIKTITFVGIIKDRLEMYYKGKNSQAGSLYYLKNNDLPMFILITGTIEYVNLPEYEHINPVVVFKNDDSGEDSSDSNYESGSHDVVDAEVKFEYTPYESRHINDLATSFMTKDDIEFIGIDDYYKIDKAYPESDQIIDLAATLIKIKEKAKEKGVKTITFMDTIDENGNHTSDTYSYEPGALFFVKNAKWVRFELITRTDLTTFHHIYPVLAYETSYTHSVNDQYADVDTSKLNPDLYTRVSFPIFMKPTVTGANVSFADICDIHGFDISETIKRIKNAAYLENIEDVNYIDSFHSFDEIFKTDLPTRYRYCDGYLFFVNDSTKDKQDPCFVILRKTPDDSEFDAILYRINPIKRPASIYNIKKIDVIDTYADGDVRIADGLKSVIWINHAYKLKEICDKRNYDYDSILSCLKGVTAIIGGGTWLTFEGIVDYLNSIVSVDPVVAYNTCSVFFVSGLVDGKEEPYFVIYMPITGKTKNGYNFHLYRIYPIPNLNQDPNTDSQDDSNVREINQFTSIYRANLEVSEADKDAYMKVEFSNIDHSYGENQSLANICYTWKLKFYDTIKRIRFVAYMNNFEEIKYAGTAYSHEEILEKEVLYSNGSVLFVSDAEDEDPHFVIVEFIDGTTCLIRINPVKE